MKESRYVRLARTILHVLRYARIPLFLHRKSNHIFTVWQHLSLLTIRQYEGGKSYRMFTEWLVEAHYLRMFLKISRIPHFTTLQKFADRIAGTILQRMISSFIALINVNHIFFGIDSSGFKSTRSSQYYIERAKLRKKKKKWIKLSVGADVLKQIICSIKIRRAPHSRHDNVDFKPIITRTS